jgi:hypothetical protein
MVIDKPEHQAFFLELIKQAQYPGHVIDLAFEVKQAVQAATVNEPPKK